MTRCMPHTEALRQLDEMIRERSILEHPFYQSWNQGVLTREQLATYARMYYAHVEAFPGYLQAALTHAAEPTIREELAANLADELGNPAPHPELWLDFAAGVGVRRADVADGPRHPAAQAMVEAFSSLAQRSLATGVAALYAYESQQPDVSRTKAEGLRAFYGIDDARTLRYFTVHQEADVEHRTGERAALAACLAAGVPAQVIQNAADQALDAYWGLLDGVCAEIGISC